MTRRADFHQSDVTRAIKAALDAGLKVGEFQIEVEGGKVRVLTGAQEAPKPTTTPLQEWRQKRGRSAA